MSRFRKLSQTVWHCQYHIVWTPKYRFKILKGEVAEEVEECVRTFCSQQKCEIIELNVRVDHVHLLVSIPPKYGVSSIIGYLKGKSALMIFDQHANLKCKFGNRHF